MVDYVVDTLEEVGFDRILVVVGYRADDVRRALASRKNVSFVLQAEQLGTGHAVMVCRDELAGRDGAVVVVTGDSPLLKAKSLRALLAEYDRSQPACLMGTTHKENPAGLGRIVRDAQGRFSAIVEEKDATPEERAITEVNMSCYVFACGDLVKSLAELRADNVQRGYYVTDCPGLLRRSGRPVEALPVLEPVEGLSINDWDELAEVEKVVRAGG
jgi:bifunctional UDP-N-acetylglucosamine pyrophosphorylase/glucosamine-1-phosphate N-acetyltransferase/UDP-N-acetylglucosamine pyrophosphorylase